MTPRSHVPPVPSEYEDQTQSVMAQKAWTQQCLKIPSLMHSNSKKHTHRKKLKTRGLARTLRKNTIWQPRKGKGRVFMEDTPGDPQQTIRQAGPRPDCRSPTGRGKTTTSKLCVLLQPQRGIVSIAHQIQTRYRFNIQKLPVAPCGGCVEGLGLRAWHLMCSFPFNSRPADQT